MVAATGPGLSFTAFGRIKNEEKFRVASVLAAAKRSVGRNVCSGNSLRIAGLAPFQGR